jgi:nitroreductase
MITPVAQDVRAEETAETVELSEAVQWAARPETQRGIAAADLHPILVAGVTAPVPGPVRPWRIVVVRNRPQCAAVHRAAGLSLDVPPDAAIALFAPAGVWRRRISTVLAKAGFAERASQLARHLPLADWLHEQTRVAARHMAAVAHALGWETACYTELKPHSLRQELGLPRGSNVLALIEIFRAGGMIRSDVDLLRQFVFDGVAGTPWADSGSDPVAESA